jgi:hypothetical protein
MSEELLKYDKLGNKEELLFILFDGLEPSKKQHVENLRRYCTSQLFSIAQSFFGILKLCEFISFIKMINSTVSLNESLFDPSHFQKKENYFVQYHFFENLFRSLKREGMIAQIFNAGNLKFNLELKKYYVLENKLPYKLFPIRNVLLSTGFFERESNFNNHLYISQNHTEKFYDDIVKELISNKKTSRKITLEQLKKSLNKKEESGKLSERFVLEYERKRLAGHPEISKVISVSDDFANAGYDIESFNDCDSVFVNRFIEVKSFKKNVSFHWSMNEIEISKELSDEYFLYLVNSEKIKDENYSPIVLSNPYKSVFSSSNWSKEAEGYIFFPNT